MSEFRQTTRADREGQGPSGGASASGGWEPRDPYRDRPRPDPGAPGFDPLDEDSWAAPPPRRPGAPDLSPLFVLLDGIMRAVPREVRGQFRAVVREALLALRALIDWYLDRLDGRRREPRVEDIPIE